MKALLSDIGEVLSNFDFDKVHQAMVKLNWKWATSPNGVPSSFELIKAAERYLTECGKRHLHPGELYATGSGGLMAQVYRPAAPHDDVVIVDLVFELESWDTRK